jgi:hypothetical protein
VTDVLAKDVVVDVHDLEGGCDAQHDALANAHELILEPVIAEEGHDLAALHGGILTMCFLTKH